MNAPRHQVGPVLLLVLWTLILLSPCSLRAQQVFGDISLEPLDPAVDGADTLHGYAEYRFRLTNASGQRRVVELIAPFRGNGMSVPNQIDRIIRRVEVGPRSNLVVSLLQPPLMLPNGGQVRVRVDGEDFEEAFTFGPGHATMFVARLNFLFTRGAEPVEDALREAHKRRTGGPSSGGSSSSGGTVASRPGTATVRPRTSTTPGSSSSPIMVTVAEQPVAAWSPNWLFYSRFHGVAVTSPELVAAATPVREALFEYAAMGGLLVVIGPLPSWPDWPSVEGSLEGSRIVFAGFGVILSLPADVQGSSNSPIWELALDRAEESSQPLVAPLGNARPGFISAIGDDIRLPVRGLFFLTVVFALLLGPVNLFFLHRKRRRVWLWWTVPATALLTTSLLTGFALFVEGSQIRVRTRSMTLLDERHDQAFTVGDQGYFSTRSIPQGVSFSQRTEVVPLVEFGIQPFYRTLHLEGGLRLAQGWVSPRIPAHFQIRSPQRRRERLPVRITGGGGVEVTNGLGAAIQQVWFCTLDGSVYWGRDIAPGESQTLTATGRKRPSDFPSAKVWRDYYRDGWHTESFVPNSVDVLRPGTYTAILADSPFVEAGVPRITHSDRFSIVHGISALSPEAEQGTSSAQEARGGGR